MRQPSAVRIQVWLWRPVFVWPWRRNSQLAVPLSKPGGMPIGVQVIANHYNEAAALRVARYLEKLGVVSALQA